MIGDGNYVLRFKDFKVFQVIKGILIFGVQKEKTHFLGA